MCDVGPFQGPILFPVRDPWAVPTAIQFVRYADVNWPVASHPVALPLAIESHAFGVPIGRIQFHK